MRSSDMKKPRRIGTFGLKLVCIWSDTNRYLGPQHTHWLVSKDLSLMFIASNVYNTDNPILKYNIKQCDCVRMELEYIETEVYRPDAEMKIYGITDIINCAHLGKGTEFTNEQQNEILKRYGWNRDQTEPQFGLYID